MRTGSRVLILVILILARLRSPIAAGEHPKQQGTPSSLKPEDFWIARNDFEALAAELAAAIAADEKLFVPEKTAQACGDNERKASNRVHRLGWYLWLANPEKAGPVLMKHFKETRYGTTRAQLCRWLGHCPSGEALQVLMDAWREEPTYGYRNAYFKAITQCSAETKLNWYAEVSAGRRPGTGWKMEVKEHLLSGWMCCANKHINQEEVFDGTVREEG